MIDLRSDTVTRPSQGMLSAMCAAEVGDDVRGDDPSVNRLQADVATRLGKEAGVIMPSASMANLVSDLLIFSEKQFLNSDYLICFNIKMTYSKE